MSNELTEMIDRIVTEKTFTMDALEAIQALKVKAEQLEYRNASLTKDLSDSQVVRSRLTQQLSSVQIKLQTLEEHEQEVAAREAKVVEHEKRAAIAEAVSAAYKDALKIVFAPNVVRNTVQSYGSVNRDGTIVPTNETRTTTTAEGYDTSGYPGAPIQASL